MIYVYDEEGNYVAQPDTYIFYDDKSFLKFIDKKRKEMNLGLDVLGQILGLTISGMSRMLSGNRSMRIDQLIKLLRVFNLRLAVEEIHYPSDQDWFPDDDQIYEMNDVSDIEEFINNCPISRYRSKKLNLDKE